MAVTRDGERRVSVTAEALAAPTLHALRCLRFQRNVAGTLGDEKWRHTDRSAHW